MLRKFLFVFVIFITVAGICNAKELEQIGDSVYKIPLILPKSLESKRKILEETLLTSQKRLRNFALKNGWGEFVKESFADRAEIYDSKEKFDFAIMETLQLKPEIKLPVTLSATLEKRVFMAVSPQVYSEIYPDGREDNAFEKLIAHEMAHRFHVRIFNGNEEAMGPVWFYEGFASYAAGMFENYTMEPSEIWKVVKSNERISYKKCTAVINYFLKKTTIQEMIKHAGEKDFIHWLELVDKN